MRCGSHSTNLLASGEASQSIALHGLTSVLQEDYRTELAKQMTNTLPQTICLLGLLCENDTFIKLPLLNVNALAFVTETHVNAITASDCLQEALFRFILSFS